MPLLTTNIRMSKEMKLKGIKQASKLGLNLSEYIRLIIKLDSATSLIERLKEDIKWIQKNNKQLIM